MKMASARTLLAAVFVFAVAAQAHGEILSLRCTYQPLGGSYAPYSVTIWIDMSKSVAYQHSDPEPAGPPDGPRRVIVSADKFVWPGSGSNGGEISRTTGFGMLGDGRITCAEADIPLPNDVRPAKMF